MENTGASKLNPAARNVLRAILAAHLADPTRLGFSEQTASSSASKLMVRRAKRSSWQMRGSLLTRVEPQQPLE